MDLLMKAATLVAVAIATLSSFPSPAQPQQDQQQQQTTTPAQQNPPASGAAGGAAAQPQSQTPTPAQPAQPAPEMQLQPVKGALVSNLDSKSAKQGDSVVVTTEESIKTASGTEIPQGSKLVGHVTNVEPRSESRENSQIAIQFDRAELKTGQNLPIQSVIQSVAPATGGTAGSDTSMPSAAGAPATGSASRGSANPSTSPSTGNNGTPQSAARNRPAPDSNTGSNATAQSGSASDQNANTGAPAPGTVVARTGNVAIRVTAIPGVLLANSITGQPFVNASGLLLGARQDIHLDGGTQIVVAVVEAPHAPGGGMSR